MESTSIEPIKKQRWSIAEIYFYLICLITLLIFIWAAITGLFGVVKWIAPEKTMDFFSFGPDFMSFREEMRAVSEENPKKSPPSEEEIEKAWQRQKKEQIMQTENQGFSDAMQGLIAVIVIIPIFYLHWKKVRIITSRE